MKQQRRLTADLCGPQEVSMLREHELDRIAEAAVPDRHALESVAAEPALKGQRDVRRDRLRVSVAQQAESGAEIGGSNSTSANAKSAAGITPPTAKSISGRPLQSNPTMAIATLIAPM
ncbi:MAG TPA: hypothetical protein VMU06_10220 [Stellaceae bacterium]|nr:hypothetical protein [Stellaceae bacterium]